MPSVYGNTNKFVVVVVEFFGAGFTFIQDSKERETIINISFIRYTSLDISIPTD